MKTAILALTALFVTAAPLAWAQEDTSPTPAATPEASRPEKSESPATDPSVSVTTEKSATPAPSKSSSSAAPTKASSPAAKRQLHFHVDHDCGVSLSGRVDEKNEPGSHAQGSGE